MILWDNDSHNKSLTKKIISGFEEREVRYHKITDIIPNIDLEKNQYILSPYDEHPNAHAYNIISSYILKNIIEIG